MSRVLDTRPQPPPRSSTIFDRGNAAPELYQPSRRVGGVDLPPGPRLEKAVGDPNNGKFFSWDSVLAERGVQTLIESDANGTPALWKGESTGGGRVVDLSSGVPMSAPMRPYQPGITGEPPHEGSGAGSAGDAARGQPTTPAVPPEGVPPGAMGRSVPFADQLSEAGILGGGQAHGWIDWTAQMSGKDHGGEARRAQDAVNQGGGAMDGKAQVINTNTTAAMSGQPAPKGIPPSMPTAKMSVDAFDVGPMLDQLLGLMGGKQMLAEMDMKAEMSGKKQEHPVSEAQRRWAFAAEERGELPGGTARKWSRRKKGQDLPASTGKMSEGGGETHESTKGRGGGQEYVYGRDDEGSGQGSEVKKSVDDFFAPLGALIKAAAGHKYKSRKKVGGKWVYDYGDGPKKQQSLFAEDVLAAKPKTPPREAGPGAAQPAARLPEKEPPPKPERSPQTLGQGEHDKIATMMNALVEKSPNHPHRDLEKIRQTVRASVSKIQLGGYEEAAKTFARAAGATAKAFKAKDKGGSSMEESLSRAMYNELRGAVRKLQSYYQGLAAYRAGKGKQPQTIDVEKSMNITMYDDAGRALRKGLWTFKPHNDEPFEALPDEYLFDYLVAFVDEAFEHERMGPQHTSAHDRLEKMACAIMSELVAYLPYNSNLRRACEKLGCTKDTIARILVEKGFLKPASDTYHHTDLAGNEAMGAYLAEEMQLSVAPFIQTEPAPVTPRQLEQRGQEDVSHLVKAEPSDPFQALMARRRREVHAAWSVPELVASITASDSCPVHSGREIQKSMQLWNPMLPCTCGETPNAYG